MADSLDQEMRDAFGAAGIEHKPGLSDQLLHEMAPLLAEDGIDISDPSTYDMDTLNAALGRAVERTNMERFTPHGKARTAALAVLLATSEELDQGRMQHAEALIFAVQPEPREADEPSVAHVIGVALGCLDTWLSDPALAGSVAGIRVPKWNSRARAAATDVIALARKHRAFDSIDALHRKHSGAEILEGSVLAVVGTIHAWAASAGLSVHDLGAVVLAAEQ